MATHEQLTSGVMGSLVLRKSEDRAAPPLVLEDVYREHVGFVARALRRLGVREDQLDDVVHDTFLIVHRRLDAFDGRAPLKSWLYGIARGVAANHRRSRDRLVRREQLAPPPSAPVDPSREAEQIEAARIVEQFLATLSPPNREVFVLSEIEGFSGPEVAEALGMKVNTVYWRLRETRLAFEQMAEQHRQEVAQR